MKVSNATKAGIVGALILAKAEIAPSQFIDMCYSKLETNGTAGVLLFPFRATAAVDELRIETDLQERFLELAQKWRRETRMNSVVALRYLHPAYQEILTLGKAAIPFILQELQARPDRWFCALALLTKAENVTEPSDTFQTAIAKWLNWGRQNGHIA